MPTPPLAPDYQPEFSQVKDLLLLMTQERTTQGVIDTLVNYLAAQRPHALRVCVWLKAENELVLRASQWRGEPQPEWMHATGDFRQVPLDEELVGRAVRERRIVGAAKESVWPNRPEWAKRDGVVSFVVTPIIHLDQVFGCYGAFMSLPFEDERMWKLGMAWTQIFADHMAAMMANTQAFDEIDRLRRQLERENEYLREEVQSAKGFKGIIGTSPALQRALDQVNIVAPTDATVLILGESGTGKELVAQGIHERSKRAGKAFIKVNCAAIPHGLFESEFFGHVRGSFTGAVRDRAGRFDLAQGGTIFLDEVGEIPLDLQGKMLRVLQEGTYERIGEERTRRADVRVIAATNRDLLLESDAKRFRQDLFYRLSVFPIALPALRDRQADIPHLVQHFMQQFCREYGRPPLLLRDSDQAIFQNHVWPGNIRELRNVIERAVLVGGFSPLVAAPASTLPEIPPVHGPVYSYPELLAIEKDNLLRALSKAKGKIWGAQGAAELLGLKPTTLSSKMKAFGIVAR